MSLDIGTYKKFLFDSSGKKVGHTLFKKGRMTKKVIYTEETNEHKI